jgi:uncharacterized protein (TIGR00661 family)
VHGYGRGHATRALAVLPDLAQRHDLLILAGGEAHAALWPDFPVTRIPTLGYFYDDRGRRSNWQTLKRNLPAVLDLLLRGPAFQAVLETIRDFRPEVVISDAEAWTHRAARRLGIPRIGFDHFGIMAFCRPPMPWADRLRSRRDVSIYNLLMGRPQRAIVSSFYHAPARRAGTHVVGPLLRRQVLDVRPRRGDYLLAYFNNGAAQFTAAIERALRSLEMPVRVYGTPRHGGDGPLHFRPPSNLPFIEDLAGCRAVISTAGNQLVGEAMHLGKPMLVMPEDCVEQRLNAAAVERMAIGGQIAQSALTGDAIRGFLEQETTMVENIRRQARDGRREALAAIERCLAELAPQAASPPPDVMVESR